ncbi:MAG TPA: hypothetical protein PL065_22930, partial [Polyangiaceae bacterium]|nr:hypothetical protein [Polyangiaceae bacterium]
MSKDKPVQEQWNYSRYERLLSKLGVRRTVRGWCVRAAENANLPSRAGCCDECGAKAKYSRRAAVSLRMVGRPVPELRVSLCQECFVRTWHRTLWSVASGFFALAGGIGGAWVVFALWPHSAWVAMVVGSIVGSCLGMLMSWWIPGRVGNQGGWSGVPARIVESVEQGCTIQIASRILADRLMGTGIPVVRCEVVEQDMMPGICGGIGALVMVTTLLWAWWHPVVRVVNVGEQPVVVIVDGRTLAVVPGVPTEVSGAGEKVRIARGWR